MDLVQNVLRFVNITIRKNTNAKPVTTKDTQKNSKHPSVVPRTLLPKVLKVSTTKENQITNNIEKETISPQDDNCDLNDLLLQSVKNFPSFNCNQKYTQNIVWRNTILPQRQIPIEQILKELPAILSKSLSDEFNTNDYCKFYVLIVNK